ncbi:MAG: glycosyltransferase family 4 protein [Planctomycetales bacterium]|nr:glycosyltransferase family 4 protein [Planctomycetales bacterium]
MRVAYISYDRFPSPKGAATHIAAFAGALAEQFGEIDLYTVSAAAPGEPPLLAELPGVRHVPLAATGPNLIERVLCFRAQLQAALTGRHYDVIHVRSIYEGLPIALNKQQWCRRLVVEVNGLPSIELKYHYPDVADDLELTRKLRWQEQRLLESADLVLTVSDVNAAHLVSRGVSPERIRVIPNGVDCELFAYSPPRRWPVDQVTMLYSGTMSPWQGVAQAIESVALCRRDFPAELHLVGESRPRQRKELERACFDWGVTDAVHFHGPVSQSELVDLHHAADVVLAPLRPNDRNRKQGCCPLKVLEAMASGTPLIASDLEVVRLLARHGQEALLVRPRGGKPIKDAVLKLQSDPHLAPQLSAAARRRAKQHFSWQLAQARLLAAYEELA